MSKLAHPPGADPREPIHCNRYGPTALLVAQITAFFDHLPGDGEGLIKAYRRVMGVLAPHLTWFRTDSERGADPICAAEFEVLPKWFGPKARKRSEYEIVASSGARVGELGPWGFSFAVERNELPGVKGHFQCCFPASMLEGEGAVQFEVMTRELCADFNWTSMTAGYAIAVDPGEIEPARDACIRRYAMQHPGVECNDLIAESELPPGWFKSVNWLTYLDDRTSSRAGMPEIIGGVPAELHVSRLSRGLLVRAGIRPVLGGPNSNGDISAYAVADRWLRQARTDHLYPLPGFEDAYAARQWLNRFESERR